MLDGILPHLKISYGDNNNIVKVFVGGGITSDSEPENEWEEIVQKSQTMLKVIF